MSTPAAIPPSNLRLIYISLTIVFFLGFILGRVSVTQEASVRTRTIVYTETDTTYVPYKIEVPVKVTTPVKTVHSSAYSRPDTAARRLLDQPSVQLDGDSIRTYRNQFIIDSLTSGHVTSTVQGRLLDQSVLVDGSRPTIHSVTTQETLRDSVVVLRENNPLNGVSFSPGRDRGQGLSLLPGLWLSDDLDISPSVLLATRNFTVAYGYSLKRSSHQIGIFVPLKF